MSDNSGAKSKAATTTSKVAESATGQKSPTEAEARAKILEGVDFIETEEDAEAVESAVVRIQSTFRGKKIRSKLGQKAPAGQENDNNKETSGAPKTSDPSKSTSAPANAKSRTEPETAGKNRDEQTKATEKSDEGQLSKRVASMQVNDNSGDKEAAPGKQTGTNAANLQEDEADRAATKIQAGFKGYKTRKELEGKLSQPLGLSAGESDAGAGRGSNSGQAEGEPAIK